MQIASGVCAIIPKNPVKYNLRARINHKGRKTVRAAEGAVREITQQKHLVSVLKALVRRFLLSWQLKEWGASPCTRSGQKIQESRGW